MGNSNNTDHMKQRIASKSAKVAQGAARRPASKPKSPGVPKSGGSSKSSSSPGSGGRRTEPSRTQHRRPPEPPRYGNGRPPEPPHNGNRRPPEPPYRGSYGRASGSRRGKSSLLGSIVVIVVFVLILLAVRYWNERGSRDSGWRNTDTVELAADVNTETLEGDFGVTFLDVGQGNAIVVHSNDEYMLVDGGDRGSSSFVVSYLQQLGVESLSYIVSSHYDSDHINGIIGALHVFDVETILDGDYEWDTKTYISFCEAVKENGCTEIHPAVGESYPLGNAEFTVVCPDNYQHEESNDNSIGIRITYGETSFLICGDADSSMEEWMIASGETLSSDVLLCSHHGSAYSTSEAFLDAVAPDAVVISCGADNEYGHPAERVMEVLQQRRIPLYRTDVQGTLTAVSDGITITWNVEPTTDYRSGGE